MKNYITQHVKHNGAKLRKLFINGLRDMLWAEKNLIKALPKLARAATSDDLKVVFEIHLTETQQHINRLERVFRNIGEPAKTKKCTAMIGLINECSEIIESTEEYSSVRDWGLIFASQKVEHYEIASYGTLRTIANILRYSEVAELLQQTLDEEIQANTKLSDLADAYIYMEAVLD
ncbi:ferritin-like domain-containing protein [Emticicia sp. BO119]|uniref:ferritin-like domain-containing protein n=1 Tax=Emticicia sp. BO119 TaxID=2757768 RepID=UPI0015F04FF5|nr:ferritin-like domain-containing protein [Emticicia sp. BO119]MBA4852984.1 ferritin-like domain-containing protein [Emticicia sp. BO119]